MASFGEAPWAKRLKIDESDDELPLSQTDNVRPASASFSSTEWPSQDAGADSGGDASAARPVASGRTIHDRIHGHIDFEGLLIAVIDTPQFQRLRGLKQLGGSVYVYPGASHTRFEHSLGVAHLAHRMVRHIMAAQPELGVTRRDEMCVKLAGLCHDLGHGPFSHMFETFVNRVRQREGKPKWEHEQASIALVDHLIEANQIDVAAYGLKPEEDLAFVKLLIQGLPPDAAWPDTIGRTEDKRFLFDIVANKRNGIDVDKLDYFVRDSQAAIGTAPIACDIKRLIRGCRVNDVAGQMQVCYQEKLALGIFDIFKLRAWLHKYVYQHHTVNLIEEMLTDVFMAANDAWELEDSQGNPVRMSDCVDDIPMFARLGDWVLDSIEASSGAPLAAARETLLRIRRRQLYQAVLVPTSMSGALGKLKCDTIKEQLLEFASDPGLIEEDVVVNFSVINYGSRDAEGVANNPVTKVSYFNPKANEKRSYQLPESKMPSLFTPRAFEEKLMYVYARTEGSFKAIEEAYHKWRQQTKMAASSLRPSDGSAVAESLTPMTNGNPASPRRPYKTQSRIRSGLNPNRPR